MIRDLLNPSSGFLELREDGQGVVVAGIFEVQAKKTSEVSMKSSLSPQTCFCYTITCALHFEKTLLLWNLWSMSYQKGLILHYVHVHVSTRIPVV